MERPSTGRRHVRAGSVHVLELISQRSLESTPARPDPANDVPLEKLRPVAEARPSSHRRTPSRASTLAKVSGLGIASLILCAAVAFGSLMAKHRQDAAATQRDPQPNLQITGMRALLPDSLNHPPAPEVPPGSPTSATGSVDKTKPSKPPHSAVPPRVAFVQRFYHLVRTKPEEALSLLDNRLLGTETGRFIRSWTTVVSLDVLDVHDRGSDVLAVIRLGLPGGTTLQVRQSIEVGQSPQRIVGARILSVQRV